MKMTHVVLLQVVKIMTFASDENDFAENGTKSKGDSKYIGAIYKESTSKWEAHRWSKKEKKLVYSGYYNDEETAAHASDTLARKLIANGEKDQMLNFPDDDSEVYTYEETPSSIHIGISYHKRGKLWCVQRRSKYEKKLVYNGHYRDEETAAHASDTLARKLMKNGEKEHKLNFPDDDTEVHPERATSSVYIGVSRQKRDKLWCVRRWSKNEKKTAYNGYYEDEETAAHASDTLARKLMTSGEKEHMLNFPDDHTEVYAKQKFSKYFGIYLQRTPEMWKAQRFSKNEKKLLFNGSYDDAGTAAHASDTLARKLIASGEKGHKLNFPDDHTEVHREKRAYVGVSYNQRHSRWVAQRWSKKDNKMVYSRCNCKNEKTAAHASDTLARKLIANGEKGHKLNFPNDYMEIDSKEMKYQKKKKRQKNSENSQDEILSD